MGWGALTHESHEIEFSRLIFRSCIVSVSCRVCETVRCREPFTLEVVIISNGRSVVYS